MSSDPSLSFDYGCDEASQSSHSSNANFKLQICLNANSNVNAIVIAQKQVSASFVAPNKPNKIHAMFFKYIFQVLVF